MAQAQDSERAAAVLLDRASFRYVDESERGLEAEAGSAAPASGSRVDDVSLSVAPGRCLVLCGRSGDGKSTVLRLVDGLAGTFFPGDLTGVVEVCGADVRRLAPRERTERLGVVMQDPRSQFFMGTVGDEIAFSAENLGVDPAETVRRVHAAAETCGVEGLLGEKLSELSSGQKQRVALAAAIACGPAVLVLDEPTSNLDAQGSEALVRILAELKRRGTAVVVSEHRLHQLLPVADAYVCLRAGRVVERWSADAFARLGLEDAAAYGLRHPDMAAPVPRRERRRRSYFVMQDADYQLYAGSVADEVVLGRRVDEALKARAWEALEAFDLVDLADRHPASLSGGQKQRVTLAAAYCSDADLIVLDEPTSGLDGRGVREVSAWCRTLAAGGKAVAIITHDNLLAALAGDAVVELKG